MKDYKAVVLLSGGLDSTTCLALAVKEYGADNVLALCMHYGQKHEKEIQSAEKVAKYYKVDLVHREVTEAFDFSNCTLLAHNKGEIEEGSYGEQMSMFDILPTYVPFRNGLFLSYAAAIAASVNARFVYYGAHADDAGRAYPDCTKEFVRTMGDAIKEGTGDKVILCTPFVSCTKADIVSMGLQMYVPYELTWSCYNGGDKPCGKCGTCIDRAKAFAANVTKDPALD